MTATVLSQTGISHLRSRIGRLHAGSPGHWGKMKVTEMITHCNAVNSRILEGSESSRKTSFKQYVFRLLFLHLPIKFPHNVKAPNAIIQATENSGSERFEKERERFLNIIEAFPRHSFPAKMYHPAFGNLSPDQWGVAAWRHMDHHLRQFGT